jgi:hypothetical protein
VQPGDVEALLNRHRHAVQAAERGLCGDGLVSRSRLVQRLLRPEFDDRVDGWINRLDSAK